ncbi:hypothetical protein B0E49_16210 [Polaromonas sp. C04]|nr:hypothetical protein B0E49_16210 [Polaromonas sp. C04]
MKRCSTLVRELGVGIAFLYLLDRLLRRIHHRCGFYYYLFVAQPLADKPRLPPSRGKAYLFRLLHAPDPILNALGRPPAVIRERFFQEAQCLAAVKNEVLVGCIWFVRKCYVEDEVRVDYSLQDESCVWDFDVFVAESERLGFLFAKQWDTFDALLKPQGIRYTVSRINAFNQRSVASHRRLGAQDCGRALFLRLGPYQWMLSNQRPFIAFGGRPKLQIGPKGASAS